MSSQLGKAPFMNRLPYRVANLNPCRYSYKLAGAGHYGLDVQINNQLDIDETTMSAWITFADGQKRDTVGDLLEVGGIHTERHRINPIVLFDHAKAVQLPIAMAENNGNYTVVIDPVEKTAKAQCFFYQGKELAGINQADQYDHAIFCEQLFDLLSKRYLRAGSIGYQILRAVPLPPNADTGTPAGYHLLSVMLLELSLVVLPANADTVRKVLGMDRICGKVLSPVLVKSLTPYAKKISSTKQNYRRKTMPQIEDEDPLETPEETGEELIDEPVEDLDKPEENENLEPYGAQVLRRIHEDASILLEDYDEMVQLLENEGVKTHLQQILEQLTGNVTATEDLFGTTYEDLAGLKDTGIDEDGKDMEIDKDESVPAASKKEDEPTPEEVVEGMSKKEKSYRTKAKGGDAKFGPRYNGALKYAKEERKLKGEEAERLAQAIAQGPERKAMMAKLYRKYIKTIRAKYRKDLCPKCKADPCICSKPAKPEGFAPHEMKALRSGTGFLRDLIELKAFGDQHRMDAYHHGRTFETIGSTDQKIAPIIAGAAGYLIGSAMSKDFGDEHRKSAAHWHHALEPITKEGQEEEDQQEEQQPQEVQEKSYNRLSQTFKQQNLDIAELEKKMATICHCLGTTNSK